MRLRQITWAFLILLLGASPQAHAQSNELYIQPVMQKVAVWCWIAIGEMIFEHYDVPNISPVGNFQCGIVGGLALTGMLPPICNLDCGLCQVSSGTAGRVAQMLETYPELLLSNGDYDSNVYADHIDEELSPDDVVAEIDDGNPVVAGITPGQVQSLRGGTAQHVALIVGYEDNGDTLIVNDPYPYQLMGTDPYLRAGAREIEPLQYRIRYDDFVDQLNWTESFTVERD